MATYRPIASVSVQDVNAIWTSDLAGDPVDPVESGFPVSFAFPLSSGNESRPAQPASWFDGSWLVPETGGYKGFIAQCKTGPVAEGGLVQLAAGQAYDVWSQVLTDAGPVRQFVGVQQVY